VGLPGDEVQVRGGALVLNGVPVAAMRLEPPPRGLAPTEEAWRETLPNGSYYTTIRPRTVGTPHATAVFSVPPDHYFVLADNRYVTLDSRSKGEIGFVPRTAIRDRATVISWSRDYKRIGHFLQPAR
jgi:signal peptidase I